MCSFCVEQEYSGMRVDKFLCEKLEGVSRSAVEKLCLQGFVLADGKPVTKSTKVFPGTTVTAHVPPPEKLEVTAENIPLDIVYEDSDLLVVNKSKGMVVHPAPGNYSGTLVNALMYHCGDSLSGINGVLRPGIVHRIDKDTSGLLIVAKSDRAHMGLAAQIAEHSFTREYEAVVYGKLNPPSGTVDAPIARDKADRKKMCVRSDGKRAVTHYTTRGAAGGFSHIRVTLETGRTHQIRVHMAYKGHAVAGDAVYGPKKVITGLHGQCLHARKIGFVHPITGEYMEFSSQLPEYFSGFLDKCGMG